MPKVKISDVARLAGVSVGTVSNVLNHPGKVKAETINLVNEAIARLGYVPNQGARQLAGGQSMTFGLVLPRLDHAFSLQIANGAHDEARAHGYDILIASAGNDDILANHYMNYFLGAQMAGVLVQPMAGDSWEPPAVHASVPTVYLDVHAERLGACVGADNEAQGRLMAEHAASCGARQVAVIGNAAFGQLALRVRGIRAFGEQSGMRVEVIDRGEWNSVSDGYDLGRELAKRPEDERPDFVIALTDVLATGYIEGLASAGLDVPGASGPRPGAHRPGSVRLALHGRAGRRPGGSALPVLLHAQPAGQPDRPSVVAEDLRHAGPGHHGRLPHDRHRPGNRGR